MRLTLALVILLAAVAARSADAETVTVQSGVYADFRKLMAGAPPASTVAIAMSVRLPDERPDGRKLCHPAVVIVHTLGGYQEANEGWHAEAFRKQGFATLTYSSPAARRLREGDFAAGWPSAIAEAYAALRLLADRPDIDTARIAIVGFSFGGEVAHLSAVERLRAALMPGTARFAAHVAYYPAGVYGVAAEAGSYTGAPILMLLGDKDDNLPVAKVQDYVASARAAGIGTPFEVVVYPGAYHAWTVSTLGAPRFYPEYPSMRKCPYVLPGQPLPGDPKVMPACVRDGRGYTMGYDETARSMALGETLAFLRKSLGSP